MDSIHTMVHQRLQACIDLKLRGYKGLQLRHLQNEVWFEGTYINLLSQSIDDGCIRRVHVWCYVCNPYRFIAAERHTNHFAGGLPSRTQRRCKICKPYSHVMIKHTSYCRTSVWVATTNTNTVGITLPLARRLSIDNRLDLQIGAVFLPRQRSPCERQSTDSAARWNSTLVRDSGR